MSRRGEPTWADIYPTAPKNRWIVTGTRLGDTYPCRCRPDCDPKWCPCWGRTDLDPLAARCCATRHPFHTRKANT